MCFASKRLDRTRPITETPNYPSRCSCLVPQRNATFIVIISNKKSLNNERKKKNENPLIMTYKYQKVYWLFFPTKLFLRFGMNSPAMKVK